MVEKFRLLLCSATSDQRSTTTLCTESSSSYMDSPDRNVEHRLVLRLFTELFFYLWAEIFNWRTPLTAEISTPLGSKFDFQDLPPWLHNSPMHEYCCIQGQPVSLPCTSSSFLDLLFPRASVRSLAMFSETLEYKN